MPETNRLYRTVCRWWAEIEVLIVTGATAAKVETNNAAIKHIKRTRPGPSKSGQLQIAYPLEKCRPNGSMRIHLSRPFPGDLEEPVKEFRLVLPWCSTSLLGWQRYLQLRFSNGQLDSCFGLA
ncbi:transposase [Arthrobacter sp. AK04]|nr:transposase [Arthrobacter sp. AK04]MCD5341860.1 transposase [Arthrobacter sp. AK04]